MRGLFFSLNSERTHSNKRGLMSDPLTGTGLIFGGGLIGSVVYGVITHTDFGVVFGALAARCFMWQRPQT